ncbi:hypothetical protein GCM10010518_40110 [Kitasatospora cinereorecta]
MANEIDFRPPNDKQSRPALHPDAVMGQGHDARRNPQIIDHAHMKKGPAQQGRKIARTYRRVRD